MNPSLLPRAHRARPSPPRKPFPRPHPTPAGSGAFFELSQPLSQRPLLVSSLEWGRFPGFLHPQKLWSRREPGGPTEHVGTLEAPLTSQRSPPPVAPECDAV